MPDSSFFGKNAIITGGVGFIGSNLARHLLDRGASVTLIDSLVPEYGGNLFNLAGIQDAVRVNISDVRDTHSLQQLVRDQDYLFNLAGQTSHVDSMADPYTDLDINCKAQLSILESCRHHNPAIRVVFASTRQIYGRPDYLPTDEKHTLRPVDVNGVNKMAGEAYHILYSNVYGIQSTVLRLTNTYGPRMRIKDARQTFLGTWIRNVLEDRPIEVWGGTQLRDFTYVDDACSAIMAAASQQKASGRVYNLGGDSVISLTDLARLVIQVHGGGELVVREFPPERKKIDIGDYYADATLIRDDLGWVASTTLESGLRQTLAFYNQYLAHYL